jgi:hypothetical protein
MLELKPFLRSVNAVGYSRQWSEFNNFAALGKRIKQVIEAKNPTLSPKKQKKHKETGFKGTGNGPEFELGPDWVAMKGEHWQESWRDTADPGYLRSMYTNAGDPSTFSLDDVGASGSGSDSQIKETDVLDYSLSYPPARSLDYCLIPEPY